MRRFSFISGKNNDQSLKLDYHILQGKLYGDFVPKEHHTSYPETVHGGLLAALLDDGMAYLINHTGIVALTAKLEIRFRKPPKLKEKLKLICQIDAHKKTLYYTSGRLENEKGELVAEAKAVFMERT